jgi:hypothetical protein
VRQLALIDHVHRVARLGRPNRSPVDAVDLHVCRAVLIRS